VAPDSLMALHFCCTRCSYRQAKGARGNSCLQQAAIQRRTKSWN